MPRETISIPLRVLPIYEAGSYFFAGIIYPDDNTQREHSRVAISRWAILERAKYDKEWRRSVQKITPDIFLQDEVSYLRCHLERAHLILGPKFSDQFDRLVRLSVTVWAA